MGHQLMHKQTNTLYFDVAPKVWGTKDIFVNIYMVQDADSGKWVLIDTGLKSSAAKIKKMAEALFGPDSRPAAILLTHGHFDHVGSLMKLEEEWGVPVYAHYLELPYLTGKSNYPPADPNAGGGFLSTASSFYPKGPVNVKNLHILPPDGSVPFLPGWKYIHTPGHAPGQVSFYRPSDRVVIAGDAVVTTKQESVMSVMLQHRKLSGPPKYFTYDWEAARNSVKNIKLLEPEIMATGHGQVMTGRKLRADLALLLETFDRTAVPASGRYVKEPAIADAGGVKYLPPKLKPNINLLITLGVIAATAFTLAVVLAKKKTPEQAD